MIKKPLKPMFKWSGGKRREVPHVMELMPSRFDTFYEPFLGGGAVWLALAPSRSIVGDVLDEVIIFYKVLKEHGAVFVDDVNQFATEYCALINANVQNTYGTDIAGTMAQLKQQKDNGQPPSPQLKIELKSLRAKARGEYKPCADLYYSWRDRECTSDYERAKRFYILRCLAYGGMLRYNAQGKFNIPYGYYKSFKQLKWDPRAAPLFANTHFMNESWQKCVATAQANDFVFLDPPYTRAFQDYAANGGFGPSDHEELAAWFKSKKTKAMIILNKDDFTEKLYKEFIVKEYPFTYAVKYRDRLSKEDATTYHFVATNY